jgi:protein-arginine kinase activator protein McsA
MNKLESIAKRIAEIHDEIEHLKSQREANLQYCHGNPTSVSIKDFLNGDDSGYYTYVTDTCLQRAYKAAKEDNEAGVDDGEAYWDGAFKYHLEQIGCKNCKAAYKAKQDIGRLKQERGRLVGNITKIGQRISRD